MNNSKNLLCKFSFDKEAKNYIFYSEIQNSIALELISKSMDSNIKKIVDLGAGSGNIARNINKYEIDYFLGIDNSDSMLLLHPKNLRNIKKIDLKNISFEYFEHYNDFDLIISSSSLHWALNLESIFKKIISNAKQDSKIAFSFFTNKSLESLHDFLYTTSPLLSVKSLEALLKKYFIGEIYISKITKKFTQKEELLNHLKHSGLLGGGSISFTTKKKLKFDIPFLDINYEILFFVGRILGKFDKRGG